MPEEFKEILRRELAELKQNKIRVIALGVCFIFLLIIWVADDSSGGEEIILEEPPPVTKDLPVKVLPVAKSPDGVKIVLGATADKLFIGDPFAVEEEEIPTPPPEPLPTIPAAPAPIVAIPPPPSRN